MAELRTDFDSLDLWQQNFKDWKKVSSNRFQYLSAVYLRVKNILNSIRFEQTIKII